MTWRNDIDGLPPVVYTHMQLGTGAGSGLQRVQVRAALRLVFDARSSDALVADAPDWLDDNALRRVLGRARARFGAEQLRAKLLRRRDAGPDRPLPARSGVRADEALAVVLHVGLGLESTRVADLLDRGVDEVGLDLDRARREIDPALPSPCRDQVARIGRYRDRQMEPGERVALFTHLSGCERCQSVVDYARTLDADLTDEVRRLEAEPVAERTRRSRVVAGLRGVGVVAGLLLGLLVVGAAAVAIQSVFEEEREPVPIVAAQRSTGLSGWLIIAMQEGGIEARNLATGEVRELTDAVGQPGAFSTLSPDSQRIATWSYGSGTSSEIVMVITDMAGNTIQTFEWKHTDAQRYPLGWLNNDTMLIVHYPVPKPGEDEAEIEARALEENALIAVQIESREETTLRRGLMGYGVAAPDGESIAFVEMGREYAGTLEVRPVDGVQLGEPVATIKERAIVSGRLVWSADGEKLYVARITDDELRSRPLGAEPYSSDAPYERGFDSADFVSIDRDGTVEHIADAPPDTTPSIVSVSPDKRYLAFINVEQQFAMTERTPLDIWVLDTRTGTTETLTSDNYPAGWMGVEGVWSPDSLTMLTSVRVSPYLEGADVPALAYGEASMSGLLALKPGQPSQMFDVAFSWSGSLAAWLPETALPARAASNYLDEPTFSAVEPIGDAYEGRTIDAWSSVSPNGEYMVLTQGYPPAPLLFRRFGDRGRRLRTAVSDMTWLPNAAGVVGVTGPRPDEETPSRLMVFAAESFSGNSAQFDLRQFDPFDVGDRHHVRYEQPLVSPDGRYTSFFVVNDETRETALWLAGTEREARRVAFWTQPENALLDVPVVSAWVAPDTLLFTEPIDWSGGLPQAVRFNRLTVEGTTKVEALTDIVGRGDDRGLVLEEMALSPDGEELAFRLRHYGDRTVDRGRNDTLHIASTSDISQESELARGRLGYGLTWIDDGKWLAAGLGGRIAVLSAGGLSMEYVTGEGADARYPLHIGAGEVWFAYDDGNGGRIMRVVVE